MTLEKQLQQDTYDNYLQLINFHDSKIGVFLNLLCNNFVL